MASLFISYSCKDIEAARRLTRAFKGQALDFWIDCEGIPPTVDWWKEIEKGIEDPDLANELQIRRGEEPVDITLAEQ